MQSPLHLAAEYGHVVVAETLIKSGANMEAATRVNIAYVRAQLLYNSLYVLIG